MVGSTGSLLYHSRLLQLVHSGETKLVLTGQYFTLCGKVQLMFVSTKVLLHNRVYWIMLLSIVDKQHLGTTYSLLSLSTATVGETELVLLAGNVLYFSNSAMISA